MKTLTDRLLGTDSATLELIASAYFREYRPEYARFIHTGINSSGKTRKDPLDGFLQFEQGGQDAFVFFEFTTEKKENLEKKWLKDLSEYTGKIPKTVKNGDVVKAAQSADRLRERFPNALFYISICTNQEVSSDLAIKVTEKCQEINLKNAGIIEFSILLNFLENTPLGQWTAQKHFGIAAQRLSRELLKWVGGQNIDQYGKDIFYALTPSIIEREVEKELRVKAEKESLIFLKAESGFGKSITCIRILQYFAEQGEFVLRLTPAIVEESQNLEKAILSQLRLEMPVIHESHLTNVFDLTKGNRFYIVIDDINNTKNIRKVVNKLISWSFNNGKDVKESPYSIICPIWANYKLPDEENNTSKRRLYEIIYINQYTFEEASSLLKEQLSDYAAPIQLEELARHLNNDPFLIGKYCEHVNETQIFQIGQRNKVVENFIRYKIDNRYSEKYLSNDVTRSLSKLAHKILYNKNIKPSLDELEQWFLSEKPSLNIIKEIAKDGVLFRFTNNDRLIFRHDRIRDILLVREIENLLKSDNWNEVILFDPYFSELIGQAICRLELNENQINILLSQVPAAFLEALRFIEECQTDYKNLVVSKFQLWIETYMYEEDFPQEIFDEIFWKVRLIDAISINTVFKNARKGALGLNLGLFRNGDAVAFARCLTAIPDKSTFAFKIGGIVDYNLINLAKLKYKEKLIKDLKQYLTNKKTNEEWRKYFIQAAGFLREKDSFLGIYHCWDNSIKKKELLAPTIWAMLYCFDNEEKSKLYKVLDFWVPNAEKGKDIGTLYYGGDLTSQNLRCNWNGLSAIAIQEVENWYEKSFSYKCLATDILKCFDNPKLLESHYTNSEYWKSIYIRVTSSREQVMPNCKKTFLSIYANKQLDNKLRIEALKCWLQHSNKNDFEILREFSREELEGSIKATIYFKRAELNDPFLKDDLKPQTNFLLEQDLYWINLFPSIWNQSIKDIILEKLSNSDISRINTILKVTYLIPKPDALEILIECWKIINEQIRNQFDDINSALTNFSEGILGQKSIVFEISMLITATLFNANKVILKEIDKVCEKFDSPFPFFKFLSFNLFNIRLPTGIGSYRIIDSGNSTISDLKVLEPYLKYMPYSELSAVISKAVQNGYYDWAKEKTYNLLDCYANEAKYSQFFLSSNHKTIYDHKKLYCRHFPSDEDLLEEFQDLFYDKNHDFSNDFLKRLTNKGCSMERGLRILINWFKDDSVIEIFGFVCKYLGAYGTRADVELIKQLEFGLLNSVLSKRLIWKVEYNIKSRTLI